MEKLKLYITNALINLVINLLENKPIKVLKVKKINFLNYYILI